MVKKNLRAADMLSSEQLQEFALVVREESWLKATMAFNKDFQNTVDVSTPQQQETEIKEN